MHPPIVNRLVITGARSGLGSALVQELQTRLLPSHTLVTSRKPFPPQLPLKTITLVADLGMASGIRAVTAGMGSMISHADSASLPGTIWDTVLIHNAGTLDPVGKILLDSATNEVDAAEGLFQDVLASSAVNTSSFTALTAAFVSLVTKSTRYRTPSVKPSLIVDISSLAATQPFPSWGVYCANKAFRAMIMRTTALEANKSRGCSGRIHTLSYSPGPLDTDMQQEIRTNPRVDETVQADFQRMHDAGELVKPRVSAAALAELIKRGPSKISELNGAVDYYDLQRSW